MGGNGGRGRGSDKGRLQRLLELVRFVAAKGKEGAEWELIEEWFYKNPGTERESRRRNFKRDRDSLAEMYNDEVIVRNRDGKYIIRSGLNLMLPMKLKENEALSLMWGVEIVPEFLKPLSEDANGLWQRLKNQMSDSVLEKCEHLKNAAVSAIPIAGGTKPEVLTAVLDAIHGHKPLNVTQYQAAREYDPASGIFSLFVMYLKHHSWYILGETGGKSVILRLDRIKSAYVIDEEIEDYPSEKELEEMRRDIQLDFNPYGSCPSNGWKVKLRITGSFVKPCMETTWFPGEKKELQDDGSLIYTVVLKGLEAITLWIMRALNCMEVIEPQALRDEIDRRVSEYLRHR